VSEKWWTRKLVVYTKAVRTRNAVHGTREEAIKDPDGRPREQGSASASENRGGRAPGWGPRDVGHAELRQGLGADDHSVVGRLELRLTTASTHAEGPVDPARASHPTSSWSCRRKRRRRRTSAAVADPTEDLKEGRALQAALDVLKTMRVITSAYRVMADADHDS